MVLAAAVLVALGAFVFTLFIRGRDLPEPEPVSPTRHLDERKAQIYENLRDLQFEYRLGKLSDEDYQKTKQGLQGELAKVMAEIDAIAPQKAAAPAAQAAKPAAPGPAQCPHCGAKFAQPLKFCGECGKPMAAKKGGRG